MIPKEKALKLISIYMHICKLYNQELNYLSLRYTNNDEPKFTDQEIMTWYLIAIQQEQRYGVRQIYNFAGQYLRSWFPALPSYQAFNHRLNRLSEGYKTVAAHSFDTCLQCLSLRKSSLPPHPKMSWMSLNKSGVTSQTEPSMVIKYIVIPSSLKT